MAGFAVSLNGIKCLGVQIHLSGIQIHLSRY